MKDSNFSIPENISDLEELAISIVEGDVPLPEDPSQLLLDHIKKLELIKKSLGDIDLPSSSTRDTQIQIAISAATDGVVVPLKRSRLFTSKTTGAIAASIALLLLISGALMTTGNSSKTDTEYLASITMDSSTVSSESSEKVAPLQSSMNETTEESAENLFEPTESNDDAQATSGAIPKSEIDSPDQQGLDLSAYETQAIELISEVPIPESSTFSTIIENLPCSSELIQSILNEPIIYSLWVSQDNAIESQVIAIFGNENLLLLDSTNCENNLLVEGIMP
ncbi:MAG TPA: hypothetical protein QF762_07985 [Acidimicrobiales bacterium]|nr:hypothetical protein [Acidimicrobiales bacterium]